MNKLSDADFAVYLRNMEQAVSRAAQEKGILIMIDADGEGFSSVRFGDYEHVTFDSGNEKYEFTPIGTEENPRTGEWRKVRPNQVRIGNMPLRRQDEKPREGDVR